MALWKNVGRAAVGWSTGGLSEAYRAMNRGTGQQGYAPLPFDYGANVSVDPSRIRQEFRAATGQEPTENQIELYSRYIRTGDMDYADIGTILQGSADASKSRLESYTDQFGQRLAANDQAIIDRSAATANSTFAGLGRQNSSALAASVLSAGGALAQQRQSAIADFYGKNLSNVMGQYVNQGQTALGRAYQLRDNRDSFNRSLLGYQTQRSDFQTDLANQDARNRKQGFQQLVGGLAGAGLGAAASGGNPYAAQFGARFGSQMGGLF